MSLTRDVISNFIGGISQQTDKLIYPNQSKVLINQLLNPIEGLQKRPPLEFKRKLYTDVNIHLYTQDDHIDHALCRLMMAYATNLTEGFSFTRYIKKDAA